MRTNAESLIGVRVPGSREDFSKGIAIGSGIYLDDYTHIEAVRYPAGSDAMGPLATCSPAAAPGHTRICPGWDAFRLAPAASHPHRARAAPFRLGARKSSFSCACRLSTATSTCACAAAGSSRSERFLVSQGKKIPTFIPQANEFARRPRN